MKQLERISEEDSDDDEADIGKSWVTSLAILACGIIFVGLSMQDDLESFETLAKFGYSPPDHIWNGRYWPLFTSVFVHIAFAHFVMNAAWLWILGSRLEREIGSFWYLLLLFVSGVTSSAFQLAFSDDTGIGASGVVYAIFGFMLVTRKRCTRFEKVLNSQTIYLFLIWLVACFFCSYFGIFAVGNAAHLSGFIFGCLTAAAFILTRRTKLALAGLFLYLVASVVPLFWCPWSVVWLSNKAYMDHLAGRYEMAIEKYDRILRLDPRNEWAATNRQMILDELADGSLDEDISKEGGNPAAD